MRRTQGSAGGCGAGASRPTGAHRVSRGPRGRPEVLRLLGLGLGARCNGYGPEPGGAGTRCRHGKGDAAPASIRTDPCRDAESSLRVGTEAPTGAFAIHFTVSAPPKNFLFPWEQDSSLYPLAFPSPSLQNFATERGERMGTRASSLCQEDLSFGEKYTRAPSVQMQIFGKEKHLKDF